MKYLPGPTIGAARGSVGGSTYSMNRYGPYIRNRAMITVQTSTFAMSAKARLANISAAWRDEDPPTKLAWANFAAQNPITDSLGQKQILTGHAAYVGINTRLHLAGETMLILPPIVAAPTPLLTLTGTWNIGAGAFELAFTPSPIGANEHLWIRAAVTNSSGIQYVQNLMKHITVSAAAQTTLLDTQYDISLRFGTLVVGQVVTLDAMVFSDTTGLLSTPMRVRGTIVST